MYEGIGNFQSVWKINYKSAP